MTVRERRSLWGSISTSRKVNRLSLKAALLYTWAIPHFDDEGFQEGDPQTLKARILPLRDDIPVLEVEALIKEICAQGLWVLHTLITPDVVSNDTEPGVQEDYIQDPVFDKRQSFHGVHKFNSEIKTLLHENHIRCLKTPDVVSNDTEPAAKGSEVKGSEVKGSEVKGSEVKGSEVKIKEVVLSNLVGVQLTENPTENFYILYNHFCPNLSKSIRVSEDRKKKIRLRLKEFPDMNWWIEVFKRANKIYLSPNKDHPNGWKPDLEFIVRNEDNPIKISEGKYDQQSKKHSGALQAMEDARRRREENG